jgi:hypothetical protein
MVRYQSSDGERNFQFWQQLQEIIEKNGENVAVIVTLIPRMDYYDITYSLPVQIIRFISVMLLSILFLAFLCFVFLSDRHF